MNESEVLNWYRELDDETQRDVWNKLQKIRSSRKKYELEQWNSKTDEELKSILKNGGIDRRTWYLIKDLLSKRNKNTPKKAEIPTNGIKSEAVSEIMKKHLEVDEKGLPDFVINKLKTRCKDRPLQEKIDEYMKILNGFPEEVRVQFKDEEQMHKYAIGQWASDNLKIEHIQDPFDPRR